MSDKLEAAVKRICADYDNDRHRMMDIVRAVQEQFGCVSGKAMELIATQTSVHRVQVESVVSFYSFISEKPKGKVAIRLCDDIIDELQGAEEVALAFEKALGIEVGQTTADGKFSLEHTPCIGMCDQAPAALINDVVVTQLSPDAVPAMVDALKAHMDPAQLVTECGDGNNAHELVKAMVKNNIRQRGEVIFGESVSGEGLKKALALSPEEVIREVKAARLRGRGGAGFPTGMKWEFTRAAAGKQKYVFCNADEGEPGTFKDRVILTERPAQMLEGMAIAGYAVGANAGIIYLRGEYAYLRSFLESVLNAQREKGLLGKNVCGKDGFDFDVRIQMGAGAYMCGEETSLISSCEGLRGDPKTRPPFPAQKGYLECPTTVNNVETLSCVPRILENGSGWFAQIGSGGSSGTKLLSISGDCFRPGVYEVPFGTVLSEVLELCGAEDPASVQVSGPSGQMVGKQDFGKTICFDDLPTGGAVMVFNSTRNPLKIARKFMDFFIDDSCGYCTPCRVGNVLMRERLDRILAGNGEPADLDYLQELGETVKIASRCGLGQTSPNPIMTTLKNFRSNYEDIVSESTDGLQKAFDLQAALGDAETIAGRASVHHE